MPAPATPPKIDLTNRRRRIVLHETQGPCAGVHRICGVLDQLGPTVTVGDLQLCLPEVPIGTRVAPFGLIAVKPRYILYREILAATPTPADS